MARKVAKSKRLMKVLVAVDDSSHSRAAMDHFIRLTAEKNCEIRVIHVVEPLDRAFYPELTAPFPDSMADIERSRARKGEKILERALSGIQAAGYRADGKLLHGHIRSTILEAAEKWKADLILLGSHGSTGLKRMLLGSVSDHVARHAHCSVLIVRPKGR